MTLHSDTIYRSIKTHDKTLISVLSCIILFTVISYSRCDGQELLTPAERLWLDENKSRIVLAVETNYQPFVFLGPKDRITGLAHEYMLLLESKIGVHFKQRRFSSLKDIFENVRSGDVHIVNAVTETPWRSTFLNFTDPYITVPNVIIMRKEHSDLESNASTTGGPPYRSASK